LISLIGNEGDSMSVLKVSPDPPYE
jgi:hypothetical protein